MTLSTATTVVGIFDDQEHAKKAIQALKEAGFTDAQIGVASREWSRQLQEVPVDQQHIAERGAVTGALVGGGLGAAVGLMGAVLIPGAAPVVAGTALLSALGGGLAGAGGGVFAGPFVALGLSEHEARKHGRHVEEGRTAVLVHTPTRQEEARAIMVEQGAYDESMDTSP
jgi:hypothetical protein